MRAILAFVLAVLLAGAGGLAAGQAQSPTTVLKKYNAEIDRVLKRKFPRGSPGEQKAKDEIRVIVAALMDYDELARQAMARHWDSMSASQRSEFTRVFRDLIERNYVKQIRSNVDYKVSYKGEKADGEKASVRTIVTAKRKGRMADTVVDYRLARKDGKWRVYDIVTDEDDYSSLVMNYRSEFNKIWSKDGYDGVMRKMRKKLQEIDS
jgi:phospholipid transport system substrate-binding protein